MKRLVSLAPIFAVLVVALLALAPGTTYTPVVTTGAQTITGSKTWTAVQDFSAKGLKSPLKLGTDYTMPAPATAPTVATTALSGVACSSAHSYTWYYAWVNDGGISALSPGSTPIVPTNLKQIAVTITGTAPSNAKGLEIFFSREDAPTVISLVSSSGTTFATTLDGGFLSTGTTTKNENCTQTGVRPAYTITGSAAAGQTVVPMTATAGITAGQQYELVNAAGQRERAVVASVSANVSATMTTTLVNSYASNDTFGLPIAGLRATGGLNRVSQGIIDVSTMTTGTNVNWVNEGLHQFDLSGTVPRFSIDSGSTWGLVGAPVRIVTVCASGCAYTDWNTACSSVTSTAATPVLFSIGPGVYSSAAVACPGQDHVHFVGAGRGVTTLTVTGLTGDNGCFKPGTSTNWTISNMTIGPCHRGIYMDGATTGGGVISMRDMEFIQENAAADEDSFFGKGFVAGTVIFFQRNYTSAQRSDGFTIKDNGSNVAAVYGNGNTFQSVAACGAGICGGRAWSFESSPALVDVEGDRIFTNRALSIGGFGWLNDSGNGAATAKGSIRNVLFRMTDQSSNGSGLAQQFLIVDTPATEVKQIDLIDVDSEASTTDATGNLVNVKVTNATTKINVYGGRYRTSGGNNPYDFTDNAAANIFLYGTDHLSDPGVSGVNSGQRATLEHGTCSFGGGTTCSVSFPVAQPDANYVLTLACSAGKTFSWSGKSANGFTINASSNSTDACDWTASR